MEKVFICEPKYQHLLKMPRAMIPPESLYRFQPDCIILGKDVIYFYISQ